MEHVRLVRRQFHRALRIKYRGGSLKEHIERPRRSLGSLEEVADRADNLRRAWKGSAQPNAGERLTRATAGFIERPSQASKVVNDRGYPLVESQSHNSVAHDLADIRNSVASDHTGGEIIEKREFHVCNSLTYLRTAMLQQTFGRRWAYAGDSGCAVRSERYLAKAPIARARMLPRAHPR